MVTTTRDNDLSVRNLRRFNWVQNAAFRRKGIFSFIKVNAF